MIERVEEATRVVPKRSDVHLMREAARDFEAFSRARLPPPMAATRPRLVASLDGKGVSMVKAGPAGWGLRHGKGGKANQKRMAVVATVYPQQPRVRTPEQVMTSLFVLGPSPPRSPEEPTSWRKRPKSKRVWDSLMKGNGGILTKWPRRCTDETRIA